MSARELVVLGTASQVPTRQRNHNGYLLRWDGVGVLFDPGDGTQRQLTHAGVAASAITGIALTHFHGDHCLGLPGVVQRINLDAVAHPVHAWYPASGAHWFRNLCDASAFRRTVELTEHPIAAAGSLEFPGAPFALTAAALSHPVEAFGYRLTEPDGRRLLPERLAALGVRGPAVGELQRAGVLRVGAREVTLDEVSAVRPGQSFAFVMDTRLCPGVFELAAGVDMLVIEATFLAADEHLATEYGHLTAAQAGMVAAESGVRTLVLTHFSQRYRTLEEHRREAERHFDGEVVVAHDLLRVPLPPRR
ncbi:ribonuclease Z [Nocardia sp. NPDC057353]|uniref:ribonuclease Z n=1 Tax=Nocardia sp. NPDC057353 TaxID=3346104 RepID=UPI003641E2A8